MYLPKAPLPLSQGEQTTLHARTAQGWSLLGQQGPGRPALQPQSRETPPGPSFLLSGTLSLGNPLGLSPSPGEPPLPPLRPPGPRREGVSLPRPGLGLGTGVLTQNWPSVLMCCDLRRASSSLSIRLFPWTTAALFTRMVMSPTCRREGPQLGQGSPSAWPPPPGHVTWAATSPC